MKIYLYLAIYSLLKLKNLEYISYKNMLFIEILK